LKNLKLKNNPSIITLFGSGETSPHMSKAYREILQTENLQPINNYLLDTPFGFQENHQSLSEKIITYFRDKVGINLKSLNLPNSDSFTDRRDVQNKILESDFIFSGPGSPTYALSIWKDSGVNNYLKNRLHTGCFITFASAAALTVGTFVIPVYEIYKVGENKSLVSGLNLLEFLDNQTVVVPHFNNQEGRDHDTSHCFIGENRFNKLIKGKGLLMIGIEEHTALTFNLNRSLITVRGRGNAIFKSDKGAFMIKSGGAMDIKDINNKFVAPISEEMEYQKPDMKEEISKVEIDISNLIDLRNKARAEKKWEFSDNIRDILAKNNIIIKDTTEGTTWKKS
tara:strand:+ start:414 stop:1430 length:1017 start_codon:yes stop_codon:yes gene_type:complete